MRVIALTRRRVLVALVLLSLLLATIRFAGHSSGHPKFGRIYATQMSESYSDTKMLWRVSQWAEVNVRSLFHLRARRQALSSDHGPNRDYGLHVGPSLLGWSSHAASSKERNGYIYMRDQRPSGGNRPLWEFALSPKRRLSDVTEDDLRGEFYGMGDPRATNVFGAAWERAAILVPEGQIVLARLAADRSTVYVIRLAKQGGTQSGRGTMRVEYVVATHQPPNPY